MKKIILVSGIVLAFNLSNAQQFKYQENIMSVVFQIDSLPKSEIHLRILNAINNIYNDEINPIQLNDATNGKVIVKGLSSVIVQNEMKIIMPQNQYFTDYEVRYGYSMNIDSKDGKFRIIYQVFPNAKTDDKMTAMINWSNWEETRYNVGYWHTPTFEPIPEDEVIELANEKGRSLGIFTKKKKAAYRRAALIVYIDFIDKITNKAEEISILINNYVQKKQAVNFPLNDDF